MAMLLMTFLIVFLNGFLLGYAIRKYTITRDDVRKCKEQMIKRYLDDYK